MTTATAERPAPTTVQPSRNARWLTRDAALAIAAGEPAYLRMTITTVYRGHPRVEIATYAIQSVREDGRLVAWSLAKTDGSDAHTVDLSFGGDPALHATCDCHGHKYAKPGKCCRHVAAILTCLPAIGIDPVTGEPMAN